MGSCNMYACLSILLLHLLFFLFISLSAAHSLSPSSSVQLSWRRDAANLNVPSNFDGAQLVTVGSKP